jgi:hypothetical protein
LAQPRAPVALIVVKLGKSRLSGYLRRTATAAPRQFVVVAFYENFRAYVYRRRHPKHKSTAREEW